MYVPFEAPVIKTSTSLWEACYDIFYILDIFLASKMLNRNNKLSLEIYKEKALTLCFFMI